MSIVTVHGGHTMYFNGTATAGTPGTFSNTPIAQSYNDLLGTTASPSTAWTAGQHVVLGDSSKAWWNATDWVVGQNILPTLVNETPPLTGEVNTAYAGYTFTATGDPTITFAIFSGALPEGLALSSAGVLSGTPEEDGEFTFKVRATNAAGVDTTADIVLVIDPEA